MSETSITAVVLTLNEEQFLPDCLASIRPLTSQILVLDSGSTDRTIAIATVAGCRIEQREFHGFADQRNAALALVSTPWALFIDADELLRLALVEQIRSAVENAPTDVAGYWIPRRNWVFGRWMRGGGWWPDYQARLLRVGYVRYDHCNQVHESVIFDGESGRLSQTLAHFNYATPREFIEKQRRYTDLRARTQPGVPARKAYLSMPVRELWRRFIRLHGYRDGIVGGFLAAVLAVEEFRYVHLRRRSMGREASP